MLWLDSNYPPGKDPSDPGVTRGPCKNTTGVPSDVERDYKNAHVIFENIKWGGLNTTFHKGQTPAPSPGPGPGPGPGNGCCSWDKPPKYCGKTDPWCETKE